MPRFTGVDGVEGDSLILGMRVEDDLTGVVVCTGIFEKNGLDRGIEDTGEVC